MEKEYGKLNKHEYVLISNEETGVYHKDWEWQIIKIEDLSDWEAMFYSRYTGCPALIPDKVRDAIADLEKQLGYEIQRPHPSNLAEPYR